VLLAGFAFLLSMSIMNDDYGDPGYGRPTGLSRWFGRLAEAATDNPLRWYGIGFVVVITTFLTLVVLSSRVRRPRKR
jgi:hypothetical protein